MKTLIAISAILSLAATAGAEPAYKTLLKTNSAAQPLPAVTVSAPAKAGTLAVRATTPAGLIDGVMVAMYDQPGTGEMLVQWLRDNKISVESRDLGAEASANVKGAIYINPSTAKPASYIYTGALIAREAAELMLADFPDSGEKRYMVAAYTGETFFELGGTRAQMTNMDGHVDAKIEESIRLWVENGPEQGVARLDQQGIRCLADLVAAQPDLYSYRETIKAAQAKFAAFSKQESAWFMDHQGSLQ